jgi:hypothetical protein
MDAFPQTPSGIYCRVQPGKKSLSALRQIQRAASNSLI